MTQLRLTLLLLRPSSLGLILTLLLSSLFLGAVNWAFIANNALVSDYFLGRYGLVTTLQESPQGFSGLLHDVLGRPTARDALSFGFVFVLGVVVYSMLTIFSLAVNSTAGTWSAWRKAGGIRRQVRSEITQRFGFRLAVFLLWLVYSWVFLKLLLPFSVSTSRFGIATVEALSGWLNIAIGLVVLFAALHVHVIFARLFALRPRLVHAADAMLEDERHYR